MKPCSLLFFSLVACMGCSTARSGPAVALPSADQGFPVPVEAFSWYREMPEDCASGKLPASALEPAVLTVSDAIYWMGERVPTQLSQGVIPESERRGFLISGLYDVLVERVEQEKQMRARCGTLARPLLAAVALEADLPSATFQQLLYTLGQAQIGEQVLLVQGEAVPRTPARVEGGTDVQVAPTDAGFALGAGPSRREVTTLPPRLGAPSTPAATLLLGETTAYGAVVRSLDALAGAGVYCVVPVADPTRSAPPPVTTPPARRTPLLLSDTVTAHLLSLPALGTGEMPARIDGIACPTKQVELQGTRPPPSDVLEGLGGLGGLRGGTPDSPFGDIDGSLGDSKEAK